MRQIPLGQDPLLLALVAPLESSLEPWWLFDFRVTKSLDDELVLLLVYIQAIVS